MPDESVLLFLLVSSVSVGIIAGLCVCIDLRANILFTKDVVLEARDYLQENRAVIQEARAWGWPDQNQSLVQRRGHVVQDGTRPVVQGGACIAEPCPAYG